MKREEAINQVCDILYGYEDVPEAMYKNACNRVRDIINQIEPYTNDYDTICNLMMNCEIEDMKTEQVENIRNMANNLMIDCDNELRNRGQ